MRDIRGEKELELFLDDPNTPVLCVRSLRGGGFHLENSIGVPASADGVCQMHALKVLTCSQCLITQTIVKRGKRCKHFAKGKGKCYYS